MWYNVCLLCDEYVWVFGQSFGAVIGGGRLEGEGSTSVVSLISLWIDDWAWHKIIDPELHLGRGIHVDFNMSAIQLICDIAKIGDSPA